MKRNGLKIVQFDKELDLLFELVADHINMTLTMISLAFRVHLGQLDHQNVSFTNCIGALMCWGPKQMQWTWDVCNQGRIQDFILLDLGLGKPNFPKNFTPFECRTSFGYALASFAFF